MITITEWSNGFGSVTKVIVILPKKSPALMESGLHDGCESLSIGVCRQYREVEATLIIIGWL